MGSIDIIKPLSNVLSSAINKSQQYQVINYWESRKSHLGLLDEKPVCCLCAMQPPPLPHLQICYYVSLTKRFHAIYVLVQVENVIKAQYRINNQHLLGGKST